MGGTSLKTEKEYQDRAGLTDPDPDGLIIVQDLRTHPNYKETKPQANETIVAFTLRCAAHLISPPMEDDEDNEFECIDIAEQVLALEKSVTHRWEKS